MADVNVNCARFRQLVLAPLLVLSLSGCAVLDTRGAVVGCQAADTATTLYAISQGAREANPIVRWLLDKTGPEGFIAAKIAVTLLVLHAYPAISSDVLIFANGLTCAVAAHNAHVAYRLKESGP